MKTKQQKRLDAIKYMTTAKNYKITAVAKRFNMPYNTVWGIHNKLKNTYKPVNTKVATPYEQRGEVNKVTTSDGSTADYYELPKNAKELQDLISHKDMNAQIGEIFRSCYRYGEVAHSEKLRDAKKIKYYAEAEIKRLENMNG